MKLNLFSEGILDLPDKIFNLLEFNIPSNKIGDSNYWYIPNFCEIRLFKRYYCLSVYNNDFDNISNNFHLATNFILDRTKFTNTWNDCEKTMYLVKEENV